MRVGRLSPLHRHALRSPIASRRIAEQDANEVRSRTHPSTSGDARSASTLARSVIATAAGCSSNIARCAGAEVPAHRIVHVPLVRHRAFLGSGDVSVAHLRAGLAGGWCDEEHRAGRVSCTMARAAARTGDCQAESFAGVTMTSLQGSARRDGVFIGAHDPGDGLRPPNGSHRQPLRGWHASDRRKPTLTRERAGPLGAED